MSLKDSLTGELRSESALTKKILERVPLDKKEWRPHAKSMTIGRLATHIAEVPGWITTIISADEFDFASRPFKSYIASTQEELLQIFAANVDVAINSLSDAGNEEFDKKWAIKRGGHLLMEPVKKVAIRGWGFNHLYHHRGQLSVFLRLLDISVPGMYGPSADER